MTLRKVLRSHLLPFTKIGIFFLAIPIEFNEKTNMYQYLPSIPCKISWSLGVLIKLCYFTNLTAQIVKYSFLNDSLLEPTVILVDIIYICLYGNSVLFTMFYLLKGDQICVFMNSIIKFEEDLPRLMPPHSNPHSKILEYFSRFLFLSSFMIGLFLGLTYMVHAHDSRYLINLDQTLTLQVQDQRSQKYLGVIILWGILESYIGISNCLFLFFLCVWTIFIAYYFYTWASRCSKDGEIDRSRREIQKYIKIYKMGQLFIGMVNDLLKYILPSGLSFVGFGLVITIFASVKFCRRVYFPYYFAIPIFSAILLVMCTVFVPFMGQFNEISLEFIKKFKLLTTSDKLRRKLDSLRPFGILFGPFFLFKGSTSISFLLIVIEQTINLFLSYKNYHFKVTVSKLTQYTKS